jgi:hypothetical protein
MDELNGDVYEQVPLRRLYILLRLDSALSDGSAVYDYPVISIEHVLPQNPPEQSMWCEWFPGLMQFRWVHRLANLVLLNHKKNSSASNYDFCRKKDSYFARGGVSPFVLTTQVLGESTWTPDVLARRQRDLLTVLKRVWRIDAELPERDALNEDSLKTVRLDEDNSQAEQQRANFHSAMISRLEAQFRQRLYRRARVVWATTDNSVLVSCQASSRLDEKYWFGLVRSTKELLQANAHSLCAFGLGSAERIVLIPFEVVADHLTELSTSLDDSGEIRHWNITFREVNDRLELLLTSAQDNLDVSRYLLKSADHSAI